ncbi:MAG: alpha/beta hydrolase [Candidatus Eisenbacteria bacterium]|nr:alpha/beta hydrolase [Candidatus Eisenbacteria bacterium]
MAALLAVALAAFWPCLFSGGEARGAAGTVDAVTVQSSGRSRAGVALSTPPESEAPARAGTALSGPPESAEPEARYVIYLHGAILETEGAEAVHPRFGRYEYHSILDSLASRGAVVLSELRGAGTDGEAYATTVEGWVDSLASLGVPPDHVTVLGFSKGGGIAMRACSLIADERVNYVFMACCPRGMTEWPEPAFRGRILSIYEASDAFAGSCRGAVLGGPGRAADGAFGVVFREIEVDTGREHGAFYRPIPEWLDPAVAWVMGEEPE